MSVTVEASTKKEAILKAHYKLTDGGMVIKEVNGAKKLFMFMNKGRLNIYSKNQETRKRSKRGPAKPR